MDFYNRVAGDMPLFLKFALISNNLTAAKKFHIFKEEDFPGLIRKLEYKILEMASRKNSDTITTEVKKHILDLGLTAKNYHLPVDLQIKVQTIFNRYRKPSSLDDNGVRKLNSKIKNAVNLYLPQVTNSDNITVVSKNGKYLGTCPTCAKELVIWTHRQQFRSGGFRHHLNRQHLHHEQSVKQEA